ncbi:methyltransferase, partial [Staphylococcus warneri]|uniref:methyltransferase n=1 Tax=Staphylococcus warneri TaxID=1292 RepID=UPI0011A8CA42
NNKNKNHIQNPHIFQTHPITHLHNNQFHFLLTNPPITPGKTLLHPIFQQPYQKFKTNPQLFLLIQKNQPIPSPKKKIHQLFIN